jgi:hypothetical protein
MCHPEAVADAYGVEGDDILNVGVPGVLANDSDGSFGYTPAADFNGSDTFTYTANDGAADSNVATVIVTVATIIDAPVTDDQTVASAEDSPVDITLTTANVDGAARGFAVIAAPNPRHIERTMLERSTDWP